MPDSAIELTLTTSGRRLSLAKNVRVRAHIFRRVGGEAAPWQRVAINTHLPYVDEDVFAPGTFLEYYVHVQPEAQGDPTPDRSHLFSTTTK